MSTNSEEMQEVVNYLMKTASGRSILRRAIGGSLPSAISYSKQIGPPKPPKKHRT